MNRQKGRMDRRITESRVARLRMPRYPLYDNADTPRSLGTNPSVGGKGTGGHSSREMSSTAGQNKPTHRWENADAKRQGRYRGTMAGDGEVSREWRRRAHHAGELMDYVTL